jgi:hypothetical protein
MGSHDIAHALYRAVSGVLDALSRDPPTREQDFRSYDDHGRDGAYSAAVMAALGAEVSRALAPARVKILDVGCGPRTSAGRLVSLVPDCGATYACIDSAMPSPSPLAAREIERACGSDVTELRLDVFESDLAPLLPPHHYDVVVIDVEPHGREVELYERLLPHVADTHVVLLKHVGRLDLFGSGLADAFLDRAFSVRRVMDYYGVSVLNGWTMRDVYAVLTREEGRGRLEEGTQELVCQRIDSAGEGIDVWPVAGGGRSYVGHVCAFGQVPR